MSIREKIDPRLLSQMDYNLLFSAEEVFGNPISLLHIGKLTVTSGQIVAADPLVFLDSQKPFTKKVAPGQYDVVVSVTKNKNWGKRYAAVMVKFTENPAVAWELALTERDNVEELTDPGDFFGYPVDAGLGCFCDKDTQDLYNALERDLRSKDSNMNMYDDFFEPEFRKNGDMDWLNFTVPGSSNQNIVIFHSGFGDGSYPCYWGIDDNGEICSIVVDFFVVDPDEDEDADEDEDKE